MLKRIALVGTFLFASAFTLSTAAARATHPTPPAGGTKAPTAPQPQGFCWPAGQPC